VIHPIVLQDVRPEEKKIRVSGVRGMQMIVNNVGALDGFSQAYASKETKVNMISFSEVEDRYNITYIWGQRFTVHMASHAVVFER
jgi:hypothetical protein